MKKRIFNGIFLVGILVWLACLVLILGVLYLQYNGEYQRELKNEACIVAHAVEIGGSSYLDTLDIDDTHRITWIGADGSVKYDSQADAASMENHSDRPEVKAAMETGYGEDTRYSRTLAEKSMYSAVRLEDGSVLRVCQVQFTILTLILSMLQPILIVLLLAVVLSFVLAARIARKIVEPINQIDPEHPETVEIYDEVKPLVDKIAEQNQELNRQIVMLQTDVDEKTREAEFRKEFTANVSHELKTPLTSISGFAEIIKNGIVKEEDIPRFAGRIYDEAQRLITLVEDIIKLSQLDEKQITAKKERLDLYLVCQDVLESLEASAAARNVELKLEGGRVYVEAVRQILEEIVYNLCDNGIKYNKENGSVTVRVHEEKGRPAVTVSDTGIGIPEEDIDRVFERFFRVNKSHSKEIGGTGLGLSIVKHGAAYHDAEIRIESRLNVGTTISILF
ncbi:MAG: sensor histidine kinase [Emergencia sp.]